MGRLRSQPVMEKKIEQMIRLAQRLEPTENLMSMRLCVRDCVFQRQRKVFQARRFSSAVLGLDKLKVRLPSSLIMILPRAIQLRGQKHKPKRLCQIRQRGLFLYACSRG